MSEHLFTYETDVNMNQSVKHEQGLFELFLECLELTENTREDQLVRVRNLRPLPIGDLSKCFELEYDTYNETKRELKETRKFRVDPTCIGQLCSIDNPPIPVNWFKHAFDGSKTPYIDSSGYVLEDEIYSPQDLRQQILYRALISRPQMQRNFRIEQPWYLRAHANSEGKYVMTYNNPPAPKVMGIVGDNYPLEWSTHKLFQNVSDEINDTFGDYTLPSPYVTRNGTFVMQFYTKDPEWRIEPKKGDIVGVGAMLRDNPYGRESMSWNPRFMRLACVNGMTTIDNMGSVYLTHRSFAGLVRDVVKRILTPRISKMTLEPINDFEAKLANPLPVEEYMQTPDLLYQHLAKVMVARLCSSIARAKNKFKKAAELTLNDYNSAIKLACEKFEIGERVQKRLKEIAIADVTIPNPTDERLSVYDLSNIFSAYANAPLSDEQRQKYSRISSDIVMNPKLAKQLATITV